ncbi:MAG: hypothetical protein GY696_21420 [Gammaproteobacteria bacterium]|nr:hypothetical protein [Gammaproteobacteria bacterium]
MAWSKKAIESRVAAQRAEAPVQAQYYAPAQPQVQAYVPPYLRNQNTNQPQRHSSNPNPPGQYDRNWIQNPEGMSTTGNGNRRCYRCGREGHIARDCNLPPFPNQPNRNSGPRPPGPRQGQLALPAPPPRGANVLQNCEGDATPCPVENADPMDLLASQLYSQAGFYNVQSAENNIPSLLLVTDGSSVPESVCATDLPSIENPSVSGPEMRNNSENIMGTTECACGVEWVCNSAVFLFGHSYFAVLYFGRGHANPRRQFDPVWWPWKFGVR